MKTKPQTQTLLNIDQNAKTVKGQSKGVLTGVLYLAPADLASTPQLKINVCPMAILAGCKEGCLNTAGKGIFNSVQMARIRRTRFFFEDRAGFMHQLIKEITALVKKAQKLNLKPAVRLNGTSDIQWENVGIEQNGDSNTDTTITTTIFSLFPDVQFYDYTKIPNRTPPANYHLTFSYSNRPEFKKYNEQAVKKGLSIAVVFENKAMVQDKMRDGFMGMPVIDGDESDVRFADGKGDGAGAGAGLVVALYAKGKAKKDTSGFVVRGA